MTYRRAFHVGDRTKVGDLMGDVIEIGLMVTQSPTSLTIRRSRVSRVSFCTPLSASGMRPPWRQVEAMLLLAAERTPLVCHTTRLLSFFSNS
jgi:hypothetical protein